jgi:hypothetical protein
MTCLSATLWMNDGDDGPSDLAGFLVREYVIHIARVEDDDARHGRLDGSKGFNSR